MEGHSEGHRQYKKIFCPHCSKDVSKSTWYSHYSLYYDRRSGSWNKSEPTVELDFDFGEPAKDEAKDEPQTVICKGQSSSYSDQIYDADEMLDFDSEDENVEDNTEVEVSVSPLQ